MIVDYLAYQSSWRLVHPGEKLALFLNFCILGFLPSFWVHLGLVMLCPVLFLRSGVPLRFFLRLLSVHLVFIALGVLVVMFSAGRGISEGLQLGLRSVVLLSSFLLFASTTPIPDLLGFLWSVRFMGTFVDIALLVYRYVFCLSQKAQEVFWAQETRWGYSSYRRSFWSLALLAGSLFIFAFETAEKLRLALEARGFEGELAVLPPDFRPLDVKRIGFLVVLGVGGVVLVLGVRSWG